MILLKEQFIALLFSLLCFGIALTTGLLSGSALLAVCVRAAILALIGYGVGLIFGLVIKNLFLETLFVAPAKDKEKKQSTAPRTDEEKS